MKDSKFKRKCIGCNELKEKHELIKITLNKNGEIYINPTNSQFGHSVYICKNKQCVEAAFKKGKLFKMLKKNPDESLKEKIRAVLESDVVLNI